MMLSRQQMAAFIEHQIRPIRPELEAPLLEAMDALMAGTPLSSKTLDSIVEAASTERPSVYELGSTLLGQLAGWHGEALAAVQGMAKARQAHVRHNALLCLTKLTPSDVCIGIVRNALQDRSVRNRRKAADCASTLGLRAVLPDLARAEAIERDSETRALIGHEFRMLRDGYDVRPSENDMVYVSIDIPDGGRAGVLVKNNELKERGAAAIVSDYLSGRRSK